MAISKIEVAGVTHEIEVAVDNVTGLDSYELITVDDIDTICGTTIQVATANEVAF